MKRILLLCTLLAAPAQAQSLPPLGTQDHVMDRLFAAAVGDEIRKACPTISARLFRVLREARALENWALEKGYSEKQIDAFLESRSERQKLEKRRDAYLLAAGVRSDDAQTYCSLGRDEIAKGSLIGYLLKLR
ncbi:MAG: DUF5333 domain-containing protein [Pseudomonadota bacterium]